MEKFKQFYDALATKYDDFEAWLDKNPKNGLIAVSVFLGIVFLLIFTRGIFLAIFAPIAPLASLVLLVIAIKVLFRFMDKFLGDGELFKQGQPLPQLKIVSGLLTRWSLIVILRMQKSGAFPPAVRTPSGISEVRGKPPITIFCGISAFEFDIPLKPNSQDVDIDLEDAKEDLQSGFDSALDEWVLPEQPDKITPDGLCVPITHIDDESLIVIANIRREKRKLVVTAFWVNNSEMAATVKGWRMRPEGKHSGGDTDATDKGF